MNWYYTLDPDGNPVPTEDSRVWAAWFEKVGEGRVLARNRIGGVLVSTVFVGLDMAFGTGPPLLWETMIFGGDHHDYQERYSTRAEALDGHAAAVALASP